MKIGKKRFKKNFREESTLERTISNIGRISFISFSLLYVLLMNFCDPELYGKMIVSCVDSGEKRILGIWSKLCKVLVIVSINY